MIIGKILTAGAGNLVHFLGCFDTIAGCSPQTPNHHSNQYPGADKTNRHKKLLNCKKKENALFATRR